MDSNFKLLDSNVYKVVKQLQQRSETGCKKYGTTTDREDISFAGWLQHLQEELLDAAVYIERLKKEVNEPDVYPAAWRKDMNSKLKV